MSDPNEISLPFANLELKLEEVPRPVDEQAEIERLTAKAKEMK